jgi:hypothetical protein
METAEKFRRYADECRRIALAARLSQDDRALLLAIAGDWLLLASPELVQPSRSNRRSSAPH